MEKGLLSFSNLYMEKTIQNMQPYWKTSLHSIPIWETTARRLKSGHWLRISASECSVKATLTTQNR